MAGKPAIAGDGQRGMRRDGGSRDQQAGWTRVQISARFQITLIVIAWSIGVIAIFLYSTVEGWSRFPEYFGLLNLYSAAAALCGAFLGFLFGVPRSGVSNDGSPVSVSNVTGDATQPNTNLEQISDWLTKILVGATLTQLGRIPAALGQLFGHMASALGRGTPLASAAGFVGALTIYSAFVGFMMGWLTSRVWLGPVILAVSNYFSSTTRETVRRSTETVKVEQPAPSSKDGSPALGSQGDGEANVPDRHTGAAESETADAG